MNTVLAYISAGLFGWLGYSVWTGTYEVGHTGKSRALGSLIDSATDQYGTQATSILLYAAGIILAFFFLILAARREAE